MRTTLTKTVLVLLVAALPLMFTHCSTADKNSKSFTLRDFSETLQPYLLELVSNGVVAYDSAYSYIESKATDEELEKLSKSEHPVLRAVAFTAMMERPGLDHFAIIMNNLADTALVAVHYGEWGLHYRRIADVIVENGRWKDTAERLKTVEKIILDHSYLSTAYGALPYIEPQERHYTAIRHMVARDWSFYGEGHATLNLREVRFDQRENALFALAKYKKPEDISLIKETLLSNLWQVTPSSFQLMENFPYNIAREVYEDYFPRRFYRQICQDRSVDVAEGFIKSVATLKNEHTAKILDAILNRKPLLPCPADTNTLYRTTAYAIWNNDCKAYQKLRKQVAPLIKSDEARAKRDEAYQLSVDPVPYEVFKDTATGPIRWWY